MTTTTASAQAPGGVSGLAPGSVVGGRFVIERAVGDDALGSILAARDQKTQKAIALRVLGSGLIATPEAWEVLRSEIKRAADLTHRNLVTTYGVGTDKGGARYVACEWMEGQPLNVVVARRRSAGRPLSLRGAYNVVAHVARALTAAHDKGLYHGAVRPSVVWVTQSGRVKLSELGIASAILRTAGPAAFGPVEQLFLAPEVRAGGAPAVRSDVFGLGGLLYTMLTGRSAADEFTPPSKVHPECTGEIDAILLRCLAADPEQRFATPEAVREALAPHCALSGGAEGDEGVGIDIDVDVDMASSVQPPASGTAPDPSRPLGSLESARAPEPPSPSTNAAGKRPAPPPLSSPRPPPPARTAVPAVGTRVSLHEDFRRRDGAPGGTMAPVASAEVDLGQLLRNITENDAPRWMVVKDGLDHGPFSGRELVQLILKGEVLGEHGLLNMDTGERRKVREHPDFVEFVEQYRLKKQAEEEQQAVARSAKIEKASNVAKFLVAGAIVAAVGLFVGIFFYTRQAEQDRQLADAQLADLYERGQVQIEGTAGVLPDPPRGVRSSAARRTGGGGAGAVKSYEEAMNQVVDLGDVSGSGGESRLSSGTIAGVMNSHIQSFFPCVSQELRAGRSLGRVRIDLAIAGSGQVLGVSVRAGSPEFQRCIEQRVASIRFPSFGAPRMGASYTFDASP